MTRHDGQSPDETRGTETSTAATAGQTTTVTDRSRGDEQGTTDETTMADQNDTTNEPTTTNRTTDDRGRTPGTTDGSDDRTDDDRDATGPDDESAETDDETNTAETNDDSAETDDETNTAETSDDPAETDDDRDATGPDDDSPETTENEASTTENEASTTENEARDRLARAVADPGSSSAFRVRSDGGPGVTGELLGPAPDERDRPDGARTADGRRVADATATDTSQRRRTLAAIVDHEPGVLAAVSGLFSRREFNIESLTVGPTTDGRYARLTVVVEESPHGIEQARKQLSTLPTVHLVDELPDAAVRQELALVKVTADEPSEVRSIAAAHDATVIEESATAITLRVTAPTETLDEAIAAFDRVGVIEIARTGPTALEPPDQTVYADADHGTAPRELAVTGHRERDRTDGTTDHGSDDPTDDE